jgi:hypothetical protein
MPPYGGRSARPSDYVFEGHELDDALEQANAALEDDLISRNLPSGRLQSFRRP